MVTKRSGKKKGNKGRVKTINLKRETIKDLSRSDRKKVKGGGGAAGGVVQGRVVGSNLLNSGFDSVWPLSSGKLPRRGKDRVVSNFLHFECERRINGYQKGRKEKGQERPR